MARKESEFLAVAAQVLRINGVPMSPRQIVDYAIEHGLFTDRISGRTPHQTMKSKLSVDVRRRAGASRFVRTKPGLFTVRESVEESDVYEAKPYMRSPDQSDVRVLPPSLLDKLGRFQGISKNWKRYVKILAYPQKIHFQPRAVAEETEEWKQVLTYVLVTSGDRALCFRRGNFSRVEDYLRGSLCIGFGGHVTRDDFDLLTSGAAGLLRSAARELSEELRLPHADIQKLASGASLKIIGVLNDDSSVVGRKHLAFVLRYEVANAEDWAQPLRGEKSIAQLHWLDARRLPHPIWQFEYWSQLCLRTYVPHIANSTSAYRLIRPAKLRKAKVIFVMGTVGSGKTEAARLLASETNRGYINTGEIMADILGVAPVSPDTRAVFQRKALNFITRHDGPIALAHAITERVYELGGRAVVDGVRQRSTLSAIYHALKRRTSHALLYVHTSPDMAHKFYCARKGVGTPFRAFLNVRDAPVEQEVPRFLREADGVVYNWFGRQQYRQTLHQLIGRIS